MLTKQGGKKRQKKTRPQYTVCRARGGGETEARKAKDSGKSDKCHKALVYSKAPLLGDRGRNVTGGSGTACACMLV